MGQHTSPGLNDRQLEAVHQLGGPCLVLAGAGSGKTRVIVHKIARLLESGLAPEAICAITFTNKAALEMKERAAALVGRVAARRLAVSTFHALGVRILRADGERIGLKPTFSILDADDVQSLVQDASGGAADRALARRRQWAISAWKNRGLDAAQAAAEADASGDAEAVLAARVMQRYGERLAAYQAVDFDDLIVLPTRLLASDGEVRARWQAAFGHILVDEYQDTNGVQYELLRLLAGPRPRFTAVGDDDQSIYGWRGATVENIERLARDHPRLAVVRLEQNYRSTAAILRAANAVIAGNPKRLGKTLWSELGDGEPVRVVAADHEAHEAERVVARIEALRATGAAFADVAVLYRANHQAKPFEQALREAGIPYRVSGGQSFFDRAEVKDLMAWLRLVVNGDDDPAFIRAATTPKRGIGQQTLERLGAFAGRWKTSCHAAVYADSLADHLPRRALDALQDFARTVALLEAQAQATRGREPARALLLDWLAGIGYEQHLHDAADLPRQAEARWAHVLDFVDWIARRCAPDADEPAADGATVHSVLQTLALLASLAERRDGDADQVTLSTLHAAKGLEWPHVVLAGVNEGLLPFAPAGAVEADGDDGAERATRIEEERRLMYVGITRARRTLVVSTLLRLKRGRETVVGRPSRFIAEMRLDAEAPAAENPRAKLLALRAAAAQRLAGITSP